MVFWFKPHCRSFHRATLLIAALLVSSFNYSQVYKCVDNKGKVAFRDRPCESGKQEKVEIKVKKITHSTPGKSAANSVIGQWCHFAKSDANQDKLTFIEPVNWTLGVNGVAEQQVVSTKEVITSKYTYSKEQLSFENTDFGQWQIENKSSDRLTLKNEKQLAHWRRGVCQ